MVDQKISNAIAKIKLLGSGISASASAIDAGTWVKTMILIRPMRQAMEEAKRFEADDEMLVAKKREPDCLHAKLAVEVCHLGRRCQTRRDAVDSEEAKLENKRS